MKIDYIEVEHQQEVTICSLGVQFPDEPQELYVVIWEKDADGWKPSPQLWFNGVACKYTFGSEELAQLQFVIHQWFTERQLST